MNLWDLISFKKTKFSIPKFLFPGFSGRPTGRPSSEVGRPGGRPTCTDVHNQFWQEGRPTDPVDRPESSALCIQTSVDRVVDWWHNGLKYDRWPVDRQVWQTPTASFWQPIYLGVWPLFFNKILGEFWASFSHFIKRVFSTILRANTSNQKGSFIKSVFFKVILWVFLHHSLPCFSHTYTWAIHYYSSYRSVVVRAFIGDQSV